LPALGDLRESIDAALSAPLDFAGLDQVIISGDVVALAVDPAVPSLPELVSGIAQWLVEHGTETSNIRIVLGSNCGQVDSLNARLERLGLGSILVENHDPDDTKQLSYIAASQSAEPIYINRTLVDADVVLPVSCSRSRQALDYLGPFGIFPLLSNRETVRHLRCHARLSHNELRQSNLAETQHAAWLLGVMMAVQVLPTANDQAAGILCGTLETLEETAQRQLACGRKSGLPIDDPADLVIAVLDGADQDWTQVARALHYANGVCAAGGSIALCTDLRQPIGGGLRRLRQAHTDVEQVAKKLSRDSSEDALAASVILESTRDHHVYLVSEHNSRSIEDLGLGVLSDAKELSSLIHHHKRSVVLCSAQHP